MASRPISLGGFPWSADFHDAIFGALHRLGALVILVVSLPVWLLIAAAIKLSSPGPVLYRGERVGRGERIFRIYKFRTLVVGAEEQIGARLLSDGDRRRLTIPLGRFLKKSKLDELPQLLNVLRGEMRLVGPRPVRPVFLETFKRDIPGYAARFTVPPGMTGIAQLRGGYYTSPRNKLRYERRYIASRSLFLDLKIVLFTLVKVLERWLPTGFLVLFFLLFVSFVPARIRSSLDVPILGFEVNLVYLFILLAAALTISRSDFRRFTIYRGPINFALAAFLVVGIVGAAFSDEPMRHMQAVGYYAVSGFLVAFLVLNTLDSEEITGVIVRGIALTSVAMSLLGLCQLLLLNGTVAFASNATPATDIVQGYLRIVSLLGNPMILAVYLVLGIPLLFGEVSRARSQGERDFWVACATISVVGIVFTQTRVGLFALLVTGTFFLSRRSRSALWFVSLFLAGFLLLGALGVNRFSPARIGSEVTTWADRHAPILGKISPRELVVGEGPRRPFWEETPPDKERRVVPNMHVTLAWELGVGAWVITMGLILTALWRMKQAYNRLSDERMRVQLWAIMSCVIGYLVSMNGMNTFHNLPLQIFFWSLVGIGLEIANHAPRGRTANLIWRFGDAGD